MTNIINVYGGPSIGKSSTASFMYYLLKSRGLNAELVREYVKNWAWEKRNIGPYDQFYFMGKQSHYESALYGKVDWIVTDSPLMLCATYAARYNTPPVANGIKEAVLSFYKQCDLDNYRHHHIVLQRSRPYVQAGRFETEAQAQEIDGQAESFLLNNNFNYSISHTDELNIRSLIDKIVVENK